MKNRDQRTRLMSELLSNIKRYSIVLIGSELKLNACVQYKTVRLGVCVRTPDSTCAQWLGVKDAEKDWCCHGRSSLHIAVPCLLMPKQALNMTMWSGIPLLVAFSSFATAALTSSKPLTSDVIFPAISLFMLLQFPLAMVFILLLRICCVLLIWFVPSLVKSLPILSKLSFRYNVYRVFWTLMSFNLMLVNCYCNVIYGLVMRYVYFSYTLTRQANDDPSYSRFYQSRTAILAGPANRRSQPLKISI